MDKKWSQFVQTTEELYRSRALRFHEVNKDLWLSALQVEDGMNVLEIGCGGGIFCHRIKEYLPNTIVTGLDFDSGHIEYAKARTIELGLDCKFFNGDARNLPFADNTFDLCFSYTVAEHISTEKFLSEQHRVLKPNGKIVILSVRTRMGLSENSDSSVSEEEKKLLAKAWSKAGDYDKNNGIGAYELKECDFPIILDKAGFKNIDIDFFSVSTYCPDNANTPYKVAIEQIEVNRMLTIASIEKAIRIAPDGLTENERLSLVEMVNSRYNKRIEQYKNGNKLWDFTVSTTLAVSGRK